MSLDLMQKNDGVIARQEIDMQITTAKAYPRDPKRSIEFAIQLATLDDQTAESCFYVLARKNKDGTKNEIKGASIRLAEIMAASWGNLHAATRIVENDGAFVTAEGVAWDLESNVRLATQTRVSIQGIDKKTGTKYTYNADMQQTASNAACAKALRNAIFKVIPLSLVNVVLNRAMKHCVADSKTFNAKRNEVFTRLTQRGIDKQKIFDFFGKQTINDFDENDVTILIGVGTAIKDKMITIDEAFSLIKDEDSLSPKERVNKLIEDKKKHLEENKSNDQKEWLNEFDGKETEK